MYYGQVATTRRRVARLEAALKLQTQAEADAALAAQRAGDSKPAAGTRKAAGDEVNGEQGNHPRRAKPKLQVLAPVSENENVSPNESSCGGSDSDLDQTLSECQDKGVASKGPHIIVVEADDSESSGAMMQTLFTQFTHAAQERAQRQAKLLSTLFEHVEALSGQVEQELSARRELELENEALAERYVDAATRFSQRLVSLALVPLVRGRLPCVCVCARTRGCV